MVVRAIRAWVRFYAELNDFLPPEDCGRPLLWQFDTSMSVKHVIESFGVPHTEVDLVLVNGESVDFSCRLRDGDRVSVYPVFESIDIRSVTKVRVEPLRELRFVLDTHLGRLASHLRLFGIDSVYGKDWPDERLAVASHDENRILLTRDRPLLMRSMVTRGYAVRSQRPREQLIEILERFDLFGSLAPFTRCLRCNARLEPAAKQEVLPRLLPLTRLYYDDFRRCVACGQVYWQGSHYRHMQQLVDHVVDCNRTEEPMVIASQLRSGMAVRFEGQTYKVAAAEYHPGQGKMGGATHARLMNLSTGTFWEHSFRAELKLEEVPLEKKPMDFLYSDSDNCYFMDPADFEQVAVPIALLGEQAVFLQEGMRLPVEFVNDRPVSAQFPDILEVKIADTAPPVHAQQDSTWKIAKLANGVEIMVPQFIKTGDAIRLDMATLKYMDRVKK